MPACIGPVPTEHGKITLKTVRIYNPDTLFLGHRVIVHIRCVAGDCLANPITSCSRSIGFIVIKNDAKVDVELTSLIGFWRLGHGILSVTTLIDGFFKG